MHERHTLKMWTSSGVFKSPLQRLLCILAGPDQAAFTHSVMNTVDPLQTNDLTERVNRVVEDVLRSMRNYANGSVTMPQQRYSHDVLKRFGMTDVELLACYHVLNLLQQTTSEWRSTLYYFAAIVCFYCIRALLCFFICCELLESLSKHADCFINWLKVNHKPRSDAFVCLIAQADVNSNGLIIIPREGT